MVEITNENTIVSNEMCTYRSVYIHVNSVSHCSLKGTYNVELLNPQAHPSISLHPLIQFRVMVGLKLL